MASPCSYNGPTMTDVSNPIQRRDSRAAGTAVLVVRALVPGLLLALLIL
jgi:hypothetical protein